MHLRQRYGGDRDGGPDKKQLCRTLSWSEQRPWNVRSTCAQATTAALAEGAYNFPSQALSLIGGSDASDGLHKHATNSLRIRCSSGKFFPANSTFLSGLNVPGSDAIVQVRGLITIMSEH